MATPRIIPARAIAVVPLLLQWRDFLTPADDPALVAAGKQGELMVPYWRLKILAIFTFVCVIIVRQSLLLRISSTHDALTRLVNRGGEEFAMVFPEYRPG